MISRILAKSTILMLCLVFLLTGVSWSASGIRLFDNKVVIHGKISEQWMMRTNSLQAWEKDGPLEDYDIFHARTTLKLETMFRLYEGPKYEFNLYGVWKNFYDAAHDIDSGYEHNLRTMSGSEGLRLMKSYETFRDICRELYAEVIQDKFQLRMGKQIISWGETSVARMTDIVNPVDLRGNLNPAYPDFAEIKRGLWMLRLFYTPADMPMDMTFEFLVIPDFEPDHLYSQGYHLSHSKGAQSMANPQEAVMGTYRDTPKNTWEHPEAGLRIRGFAYGFDWTFLYFHHRADIPTVKTGRILFTQLAPIFDLRNEHNYKYGWQDSLGFTFNKTIDKRMTIIPGTTLMMSGIILKGEFLAELGKDYTSMMPNASQLAARKDINRYAFVMGWDCKIFIPGLTPWARNKLLSSSTQLFMEWAPSRHRMDMLYPWYAPPTPNFRQKGHHWSMITQSFSYELWNGRILPGFYWAHHLPEGAGYFAPAIGFKPTFNWTFLIRYLNYYGYPPEYVNHLDSLTFEITYEF